MPVRSWFLYTPSRFFFKDYQKGRVLISYYESEFYDNIDKQFLYVHDDRKTKTKSDYHDSLVHQGFNYQLADLDCSSKNYREVMSYLSAKADLSHKNVQIYDLEKYEKGLLQVNTSNNSASIHILDNGYILKVLYIGNNKTNIADWIDFQRTSKGG